MNINDCLRKRWLIKENPDLEKAKQSVEISKAKLQEAELALKANLIESAIVFSYASMFHAGRALLFKDGFREKGHVPLLIYLEEKYPLAIGKKLLFDFNTMRLERHDSLYGLKPDYGKKEAEYAVETAKLFLEKVAKILGV